MSKYGKTRKGHPVLVTLLVLILLLVAGAAVGASWLNGEISGSNRHISDSVTVEIPKGASVSDIAAVLQENDVIGNALVFRAYIKYVAEDVPAFQYGSFTVVPMEGYGSVIRALTTTTAMQETVTVTFPEGYNAYQMGEVLEKAGLCTSDAFMEVVQNHTYTTDEVAFWDRIRTDSQKLVRLDGYLFPDTYQFFPDATPEQIVLTMLQNFAKKALTPEREAALTEQKMELEDWVIFGSIIQKEAANVTEMYNVSSVFHNRLQPGSGFDKLESCTTRDYINNYMKPAYDGNPPADLLAAYDTYGKNGFPAGAIANPGADALDAVLNPSDTPYYFFVTDVEYNHYYGKTFAEHEQNIQKAVAVNKTHGIDGLVGW